MRFPKIAAWAAVVVVLCGSVPAYAELVMGVFPRRPVAVSHKMFSPLAEHLSQTLGEPVKLVVTKNFKEFWKGVKSKKFDLVHYNQYHYVKSHKELGYNVIAVNEEFGNKEISGSLVIRTDSGISSVKDLKGKNIIFGGGKKAMGSYIGPTAVLKKAGLKPGVDYTEKFAKNPPSSIIATFNHAADAGGAGSVILQIPSIAKKTDISKLKILAKSDSYIHLPWAVKSDLPKAKVKKIQSAMVALKDSAEGKKLLKKAKVTGFHAADDSEFGKVREIVKFSIGESY